MVIEKEKEIVQRDRTLSSCGPDPGKPSPVTNFERAWLCGAGPDPVLCESGRWPLHPVLASRGGATVSSRPDPSESRRPDPSVELFTGSGHDVAALG